MKCVKCGREIDADTALVCNCCGRDYCEVCASLCGVCDCNGDFTRYN